MNEKYSALFTPWKIGNVEIKNRIVQPSMGGTSLFGWLEPCHFDKGSGLPHPEPRPEQRGPGAAGYAVCPRHHGRPLAVPEQKDVQGPGQWLPEFHKTGSKLFVQLSAGMGRSMAINEIMVKMLQNKALRRRGQAAS